MQRSPDDEWDQDGFEAMRSFVQRIVVEMACDEIDMPHIVVHTDPSTGFSTYFGPFESAMAALQLADQEERDQARLPQAADFQLQVAPLQPVAYSAYVI